MNRDAMKAIVSKQLPHTLSTTQLTGLGTREEGKVRDCYIDRAGQRRTIVVTDRISAFDQVLGTIPFKGQVLNQIAAHWFEVCKDVADNHVLSIPDPNVTVGVECQPLAAEFVMRAYLTGSTETSIWAAYERGDRTFCGHALPDGMRRHQRLPKPILTPSTKAPKGEHDISVSGDYLIEAGAVTADDFARAAEMSAALFARGQEEAAKRGLILVDTKYEMGRTPDGRIVVIDEIHTPDSSRYWYADSYDDRMAKGESPRSLDKEYVRRWLSEERNYRGDGAPPELPDDVKVEAALRYIEIYELVTGRPFEPVPGDPTARIIANLEAAK